MRMPRPPKKRTPARLRNPPTSTTDLLLAIVLAVDERWKPQLQLLAALVQVNRKLATMLVPEARRTFCVWSDRQIENIYALPDAIRNQIQTLFVEARPPLPDAQQSADLTFPCPNLLLEEVVMAFHLLPAVRNLLFSFHGVVTNETRRDAFRFPIFASPNSQFNSKQAFLVFRHPLKQPFKTMMF